jgi:hypothetical protein
MYNNTEEPVSRYLREIPRNERKKWRPQKQKVALKIFEAFLNSKIEMAEVKLDDLPEPVHRKDTTKTKKQDSFASSFYAWKRKKSTQEAFKRKGLENVLLIRRAGKIALKKIFRNEGKRSRRKK